jgi:hypothetical protein
MVDFYGRAAASCSCMVDFYGCAAVSCSWMVDAMAVSLLMGGQMGTLSDTISA